MAAAQALDPQPGERVLDLAAAPGGKATHIAALMQNHGVLVANEIHPKRVWDLVENLERCGVMNAVVLNETPQRLAAHFGTYFDRVLVDAPCSGEGMFRKGDIARQEWSPELVRSCATRQSAILDQAACLVNPGGRLVYTTCTFSVEENEGVVAGFLERHPEYGLEPLHPTPGFSPARPGWAGLPASHLLGRAAHLWPHLAPAEGHFIAVMRKLGSSLQGELLRQPAAARTSKRRRDISPNNPDLSPVTGFFRNQLALEFDTARLSIVGSYAYWLPENPLDFDGLQVIHPGWWLGTLRKGRFIPSHSLALALTSTLAQRVISFSPADTQLSVYLSGASFASHGADGWVLIAVDGFPVGWGKRVNHVIKNYYPHGLRRTI